MNFIHLKTEKQSISFWNTIFLVLLLSGCVTFQAPVSLNEEASIHERALTEEDNGVRVSAAVVGDQEALEIFGIDLARKKIQAVWVAVENQSKSPLVLLPTAIDPEYYAPLEVAYAYHKGFTKESKRALNEHLLNLNFPIRSDIVPGSQAAGYIFTSWKKGMKVIDIDLVGDSFSQNFTFFAPNPDSTIGLDVINRIETMYTANQLDKVESEVELRNIIEQLPCCVTKEIEGSAAEPVNLVIIGTLDNWTTAFLRRGYSYQALNPRYLFNRTQDISGKKLKRGYTLAQAHTIRFWQTPIRYQGKPVWVGQTSVRLGGRFATKAPAEVTLPLDPHVDEARLDLIQDLAYSQALIKIGFVKVSGRTQTNSAQKESEDVYYTTDGLRAVLVFGDRPASLEEIDFFDWERLVDYR